MEHVDQLRTMAGRLSRLNQALQAWDTIEAEVELPAGERTPVDKPDLSRRALKGSLIMLLADINRLDQEISAGNMHSLN